MAPNTTPTPGPTGVEWDPNNPSGGGGGNSAPGSIRGDDGRIWLWDSSSGSYVLAPPEMQPVPEAVPTVTARVRNPIAVDPRASAWVTSTAPTESDLGYFNSRAAIDRNIATESPDAFNAALSGQLGLGDSLQALMAQGLTYPQAMALLKEMAGVGDPSGGGGGGGSSAAAMAQLAYQMEQDKIQNALAVYTKYAADMQRQDELAALENANTMGALPYMVNPTQTHFAGVSPQDAIVGKYGLTSPVEIRHQQYSPALPPNPTQQAADNAFAAFRKLAGV